MKQLDNTISQIAIRGDCDAEFSLGTKVVCIDDKHYHKHHTDPIPKYGTILTVKNSFRSLLSPDVYLQFEEIETKNPLYGYHFNRFVSYEFWLGMRTMLQ